MPESCAPANRAGRLAAAVAGLALLAAATGCGSSGGSGKSSDSKSSDSNAAGSATGIQLPKKIASLTSAGEDTSAFKDEGIPSSVVKNLHAANYYDDADSSRSFSVEGGAGLPLQRDGSADKIKWLMARWLADADTNAHPVTVSSGSAGGTAECFPSGAQPKNLDCGWVSGKVAVTLLFHGYGQSRIKALVPQILSAIAQP
jgi:hypothetical protein